MVKRFPEPLFATRKNDTTYLVDKMYVASIIRTRIICEEIKLSCQKLFHCYDIFKTKKLCNCFIFPPRVFLALILRQFWDGHLYSVSYQRDRALFDSFKVPHHGVVVVVATVEARELASSFTDKYVFLQPSRVSIMKLTFPVYK